MSALLPANDTAWPPPAIATRYRNMELPEAWYTGDANRLRRAHSRARIASRTTMRAGGGVASSRSVSSEDSMWAQDLGGEMDTRRHLPLAEDIAKLSADLLFSDPPTAKIVGPTEQVNVTENGKTRTVTRPTAAVRAAQQRLDNVLDLCNFHATLLAAGEISAALGYTGLRIAFDKASPAIGTKPDGRPGRPVITRVDADAVIPHYQWGQLVGVTFWREVERSGDGVMGEVWRHLEVHEGGRISHALYKGSGDTIGKMQPLSAHTSTARLAALAKGDPELGIPASGVMSGDVLTITIDPAGGATATSIPNMLPDPLERSSYAGRSDLTPAVMDVLDAADKAYTQLMDAVDDAKSRLLISDSMLERNAPGNGARFDLNQRVFTKLKVPPAEKEGGGLPIEKVQFEMHVEEYLSLIDALTYKAMDAAGYNPNTEREQDGSAMTATEFAGRNRKSMTTRDKKLRYWQGELSALLSTLLAVDVAEFGPIYEDVDGTAVPVQAFPVQVTFPDAVQPTMIELANTAKALKEADAASRYIRVKAVHPEWDEQQIQDELDRIEAEASVVDPVSFGSGGFGVGAGDGA